MFLEQEDDKKEQVEKEKVKDTDIEKVRKSADEEASTNVGIFELVDGTQVSYTFQAHLVSFIIWFPYVT